MSYTMQDAMYDSWVAEQEGYKAGVGSVAVAAARLEHDLHDAVARCFNDRFEQAERLLRNVQANELLRLFGEFYAHDTEVRAEATKMTALLSRRNTVIHGVVKDLGTDEVLHNRRIPGKTDRKPTVEELDNLAQGLFDAAHFVNGVVSRSAAVGDGLLYPDSDPF